MSKKITQLPSAGAVQGTDLLIVEQASGTKKMPASIFLAAEATANQAIADANTALVAASGAVTAAGGASSAASGAVSTANQAQADASQALSDSATALAQSSGVANKLDKTIAGVGNVTLDVPKQYGTHTNPLTGNITVSLTGADLSVVQFIYHTGASAPTITVTGGTTVRWGVLEYTNNQTNIIGIFWMGGTEVGFSYIRKF